MSFSFWQKWILTLSFLTIVFGLMLILFNQTPLFDYLLNRQVNVVFWGNTPINHATLLFQQWAYATLGAVLVGWGIFMTFISAHPFRNKEKWSWNCLTLGMTLWFIADTSVSLYFDVCVNVILNVVFFIAFILPLIFTKKYFH